MKLLLVSNSALPRNSSAKICINIVFVAFRGALVVSGNVTVDLDFLKAGVEVSFETEASLDFITTVQFSEYPFLVCIQMEKATFPMRYRKKHVGEFLSKKLMFLVCFQ